MTINATRKIISLTGPNCSFGNTNACRVDVVAAGSTWQLASGHWVPRKFDAVIAHPRPTAETAVYEQHRNAYPGLAYSTRVLVSGGAYPFRFELVTGPSGMTIGETLVASGDVLVEPTNYGKIEWANPTAGDHTVTVRVYDQDYGRTGNPSGYVEVTWTLTVGTGNWVFIDPVNGNNANAGTLAAPFADTTPFITGSTYANKCVMVRQGTMNLVGMGGGNYAANADAPKTFVGYAGETATIEMTAAYFVASVAGFALYGLTVKHGLTPFAPSQRMVYGQQNAHRLLWAECNITHYTEGTTTGNNPGSLFLDYGQGRGQYPCLAYNNYTGVCGAGLHGGYVERCVVHGNRWYDVSSWVSDTSQGGVVFLKYSSLYVSVRANQCWDNVGNAILGSKTVFGFKSSTAAYPGEGQDYIEFCYNTLYTETTTDRRGVFGEGDNNASDGDINHYHLYRNSFGTRHECEINVALAITNSNRENNVFTGGASFNTDRAEITMTNNLDAGTYLDVATMKLTGVSRTSYLGTHGAEIV